MRRISSIKLKIALVELIPTRISSTQPLRMENKREWMLIHYLLNPGKMSREHIVNKGPGKTINRVL